MSERQPLRAGPWSLDYHDGDLRDLRIDGVIIVSRIYVALRDGEWRTIGGAISGLRVESGATSFRITYRREHRGTGIVFDGDVILEGHDDGRIAVSFRGVSGSAFSRNRIGLCVHHDHRLAGGWVRVAHGDGRSQETVFPRLIAPHQPFLDVAALTVRTCPGREVTVRFTGDVFETEDQRNWGDASFKTYSTPLSRPRPVQVQVGDVVEQRIEVSLAGAGLDLAADFDAAVDDSVLRRLGIGRLRAVLRPGGDLAALHRAPLPLDLVLHGPPESWPDLAGLRLASVVAVPGDRATTPTAWVERLRVRHPGIAVGGGNASQFTELNRQRPDGAGWDVVDIPVDPYVHTEDGRSLFSNVPALSAIAATAAAIMPGARLHLALAHGRHQHLAERHRDELGGAWLWQVIGTAAAAGVAVLSLGPASDLVVDGQPSQAGRLLG